MRNREFEPKLVTCLREGYRRDDLVRDVLAGLVVGVVALPLAIAFGIASGVRPEQGLATAIVAGFLISALGGSRVQVGGPTGAFVVLVAAVVEKHGYDGLAVATLLAGVLLLVMGLTGFGAAIRFVPYPVTVGFTSGIALIIAAGQVRDALGLRMAQVPAPFLPKLAAYAEHIGSVNPWALALTAITVVLVPLWGRLPTRVPGPLVAILAGPLLAHLLRLPVETIGDRFGSVGGGLRLPSLPRFDGAHLPALISPAVSIALLGGIESLLSAVVADGMTGRRHRSSMELVAQGVANLASPLFGGIPATGAIARTATNVKSGARTPIAGMVHAATLLVILLVVGKWAALIPMATLAGILLVVAWNMSEWHVFVTLFRSPRGDVAVLLLTFLLTVLVDLTVAIQVGVVLASLLFMRRMAEVSQVRALHDDGDSERVDTELEGLLPLPAGVEAYEIRGSFFFGSAAKFSEVIGRVERRPRVVIVRMRDVLTMDATGMRSFEEMLARFQRQGTALLVAGLHAQPLAAMRQSGLLERIGEARLAGTLAEALAKARELVAGRG